MTQDTKQDIEVVWREYHDRLLGFLRKRVDDPAAAEDLLQEVFLKIATNIDSLRDNGKLQSWMYQIARNAIVDYYRSRGRTQELPEALPSPERDAIEQARKEIASCLVPFIQSLPDPYREAVLLSEIAGLPQREVAVLQGISLSGAKSRVQRGRRMMKERLTDCCRFEFDRQGTVMGYEPRVRDCDAC